MMSWRGRELEHFPRGSMIRGRAYFRDTSADPKCGLLLMGLIVMSFFLEDRPRASANDT